MIEDRDKVNGVGRQLRRLAADPLLDVEDLTDTFGLIRQQLVEAEAQAVANLRAQGRSWTDIARGLGITRQVAHKRFRHVTA